MLTTTTLISIILTGLAVIVGATVIYVYVKDKKNATKTPTPAPTPAPQPEPTPADPTPAPQPDPTPADPTPAPQPEPAPAPVPTKCECTQEGEIEKLKEQLETLATRYNNLVKVLDSTIAANKADSELKVNGAKIQRAKLQLAELLATIEALIADTDKKLVGKEDQYPELKQAVDELRTRVSGAHIGAAYADTVQDRLSGNEVPVAKAGEVIETSLAAAADADADLQESTDKLNKANSAEADLDAKKAAYAEKKQAATDNAAELKKPIADADADVKATEAHAACYEGI